MPNSLVSSCWSRNLARILNSEVALYYQPDSKGQLLPVISSWGLGPRHERVTRSHAGGVVGRALGAKRAALEPLDHDHQIVVVDSVREIRNIASTKERSAHMTLRAQLTVDQSQERVEGMMEEGTAFSEIEDVIEASELSTVHKAALWLLAWSLRDVEQQRLDARLTLAAVGAGELRDW